MYPVIRKRSPDTALHHLRYLAYKYARNRYPTVPKYALSISRYNDNTANGLTRCIIDFIRYSGGQAERISCTGRILDKRKQYVDSVGFHRTVGSIQWIKPSMQSGTADISATYGGLSIKIEVKIGRDRQRPSQAAYQCQIEAAGGFYFIAHDFQSFYEWFIEIYKSQ